MDFSNTHISTDRHLFDYAKVRALMSALLRNTTFHVDESVFDKEYLDVGCGPKTHDHFINLDYNWTPDIDVCWDVTTGLPFADNSLKGIFTEHCLEHLPLKETDFVISEFFRVLVPGGDVRIIVPDGEIYLSRYYQSVEQGRDVDLPYADRDEYDGRYTPILSVNRIFRAHGHQFIHDEASMRMLLEKHGFAEIEKEAYQSGRTPHPSPRLRAPGGRVPVRGGDQARPRPNIDPA